MEIPFELNLAIETQLASVPTKKLSAIVSKISQNYRNGLILNQKVSDKPYIHTYEEALAYIAFRMPATYAAVYFVLSMVKELLPNFTPRTLLDVGAGPGTVAWAAAKVWPGLQRLALVEKNHIMIDIGKKLTGYAASPVIRQAEWIEADVMTDWESTRHDVVVVSYLLNELSQDNLEHLAIKLWDKTEHLLMLIEPGTPAGFSLIRRIREVLTKQGASILAPCPHGAQCPVGEGDWCHFSQRLNRTRLHRQIKGGTLSYEDEKFSFVCLSRIPRSSIKGIVIRHPQIRKGHIYLKACTPQGIINIAVSRKDNERFKEARKLEWGSVLPQNLFDISCT